MGDYEDYLGDRSFSNAFSRFYRGRHHPADALWWATRPTEDSPRGTVTPAAERAMLQRLAFSRSGGADAQSELARFEAALAADQDITAAAIVAARAAIVPAAPTVSERTAALAGSTAAASDRSDRPDEQPDDRPDHQPDDQADDAEAPGPARLHWWPVAAIAAALLAGVLVGTQLMRIPADTTTTASSVPGGVAIGQSIGPSVPQSRSPFGFAAFDRVQRSSDIPTGIDFDTPLDAGSFRLLSTPAPTYDDATASGAILDAAVYAVRDTAGSPCLIVQSRESREAAMNCIAVAYVGFTGISVTLQTRTKHLTFTWSPDGDLSGTGGDVTEPR